MPTRFAIAATLLLVAWNATGQTKKPAARRFHMASNFWVNLHQTLAEEATFSRGKLEPSTDDERKTWREAIEAYKRLIGQRSILFDRELARVNDILSTTPSDKAPRGIGTFASPLAAAAPIYRKYGWAADDKANRFWISATEGMLAQLGEELIAGHERVYAVTWPKTIRVDVSAWAGQFQAYTTDVMFPHSTLSSRHRGNQGFAALEIVLHESSHVVVDSGFGTLGPDLSKAAQQMNRPVNRNLWHAVLFYTSGELTRRALESRAVTGYVPYADLQNLWTGPFRGLREPVARVWQEYLDGRRTYESAIQALAESTL